MAYGTMYKHVHWYIPHYFPRHCRHRVVGLALVAGGVVLVVRIVNYIRERKERAKQEKDVVYVYTYQRPLHVPNASAQGLKLETWLRMSEIPHEVKFGTMCYHSRMGHDPFVIVNGEEIRDFILDRLAAHFHAGGAEEELDDEAKGKGVAIERMLDNHTGWAISMQSHVYKGRELLKSLGFPFPLAMLVGCHIRKHFLQASYAHGIGRYSREEIGQLRSEDIRALSRLLGDKSYMLGDKPTKVDAAVFGHLAQIVYWPNMEFPEMALLQGEAKNVHDYIDRIRAEVWPDWNERCRSAVPSNR